MDEKREPVPITEFRFSIGEIAKILGFKNGSSLLNSRKDPFKLLCEDYIEEIPASYAAGKPSKKSISYSNFNKWIHITKFVLSDKGCKLMETIYNEYCKWFKTKFQTPTLEELNLKILVQEEKINVLTEYVIKLTTDLISIKRKLKMH